MGCFLHVFCNVVIYSSLQVQIGRDSANVVHALFHIVQIGGDGKMLEELCGCYHSRHRFCRMCLEKRRALFTSPKESYQNRNDGEHEALAFKLAEVDARIVAADVKRFGEKVEGAKRYTKTANDRELEAKCYRVSIDAGDNALYELFYYANCRGIGRGLHGACWPDILHVVLKGIVEKNLSWSLALVYGLPRIIGADWVDSMASLNDRVALLTPISNLHGIR